MTIYKNTSVDFANIKEDFLPTLDNTVSLGKVGYRFKGAHLGQGTLYITDSVLGTDVGISITNGILFIDGIAQAQLPNVKVTNLTFNDASVQTTAFIPGVGQLKFRDVAPLHDHGAAGDKKYDACLDGTHLYICINNYVNNSTTIWNRIAYSSGNW
jgi:hypothetical protein